MPKKILIVEDEEMIAEMYKIKFIQAGMDAEVSPDGIDGIKKALEMKPDLILLDLFMPKMNGYEALVELKKNPETCNITTYILSNLVQNSEINKGFELGANGFMVKASLTPAQLVENVQKIFDGEPVGIQKTEIISINGQSEGDEEKLKVLIIEDEQLIVEMYESKLKQSGYEVESAKNGAWGLKLAQEKKFDAILLDMVMPAMNGHEALRQLRSGGASQDAKILVLSNSGQDQEVEEAMKLGASCYLIKSLITPTKIIDELKKIIKK